MIAAAVRATREARRAAAMASGPFIVPLDGACAFLRRRDSARLVSVATATGPDGGRIALLLRRRQARRSALVVVPDRSAGIALAGRLRVDLARVRVSAMGDDAVRATAATHLPATGSGPARPWHAG